MTEHPDAPHTAAEPEVLCAVLAWWLAAAGRVEPARTAEVAPVRVADALSRYAVRHEVAAPGEQAVGLEAYLTSSPVPAGAGVALARPGDLVGLAGGPEVNTLVAEVGAAVVCWNADREAYVLVPAHVAEDGSVVRWRRMPAGLRPPPDLVAADRGLRSAMIEAADGLAALDVARWSPEIADELTALRTDTLEPAPPGVPTIAQRLAAASWRAYRVAVLASRDEGAVVSASESARRDHWVEHLERAARRALVAAYSADAWPPATDGPAGR